MPYAASCSMARFPPPVPPARRDPLAADYWRRSHFVRPEHAFRVWLDQERQSLVFFVLAPLTATGTHAAHATHAGRASCTRRAASCAGLFCGEPANTSAATCSQPT